MSEDADNPDGWTWQRPIGLLRCGRLTGRIDVSQPQLGLHQLRLGTNLPLDGHVVGVRWVGLPGGRPANVADSYLRAGDLVATYQPQANWPYAPQIYWRAELTGPAHGALAAVTLWVSVQTDLLDTHPNVCVESQLPVDGLVHVTATDGRNVSAEPITDRGQWQATSQVGTGCLVWRLPGGRTSCAQFARTGDVQGLEVQRELLPLRQGEGSFGSRWQLFADFLEKGVIRRACLQTVFLAREDDVAQAAACCRAFQSRPLPLAT